MGADVGRRPTCLAACEALPGSGRRLTAAIREGTHAAASWVGMQTEHHWKGPSSLSYGVLYTRMITAFAAGLRSRMHTVAYVGHRPWGTFLGPALVPRPPNRPLRPPNRPEWSACPPATHRQIWKGEGRFLVSWHAAAPWRCELGSQQCVVLELRRGKLRAIPRWRRGEPSVICLPPLGARCWPED